MYAVIETGGKQYRVEVGTELQVELLDAEPGKTITIDRVLLVADGDDSTIGRPLVADATVSVEVVSQTRGPKLISFKYRPKARSRVKKGHRQELTVLRVTDVRLGTKSAAEAKRKDDADAKTERQRLEEAAAKQAAADAELAAKLAKQSKAKAKADEKPASRAKSTATAKATPTETKAPAKASAKAAKADSADDAAGAADAADAAGAADAGEATEKPAPKKTSRAKKDE